MAKCIVCGKEYNGFNINDCCSDECLIFKTKHYSKAICTKCGKVKYITKDELLSGMFWNSEVKSECCNAKYKTESVDLLMDELHTIYLLEQKEKLNTHTTIQPVQSVKDVEEEFKIIYKQVYSYL